MSVIIRLQGLPWSASAMNIRHFFTGLNIPAGGVHIIGGDGGDAFIAFSSDDDARMAMKMNMCPLNGTPVQLFLSSKSEMQGVIDAARSGNPAGSGSSMSASNNSAGANSGGPMNMGTGGAHQIPMTPHMPTGFGGASTMNQSNNQFGTGGFQNMPQQQHHQSMHQGMQGLQGHGDANVKSSGVDSMNLGAKGDWQSLQMPGMMGGGGVGTTGMHNFNANQGGMMVGTEKMGRKTGDNNRQFPGMQDNTTQGGMNNFMGNPQPMHQGSMAMQQGMGNRSQMEMHPTGQHNPMSQEKRPFGQDTRPSSGNMNAMNMNPNFGMFTDAENQDKMSAFMQSHVNKDMKQPTGMAMMNTGANTMGMQGQNNDPMKDKLTSQMASGQGSSGSPGLGKTGQVPGSWQNDKTGDLDTISPVIPDNKKDSAQSAQINDRPSGRRDRTNRVNRFAEIPEKPASDQIGQLGAGDVGSLRERRPLDRPSNRENINKERLDMSQDVKFRGNRRGPVVDDGMPSTRYPPDDEPFQDESAFLAGGGSDNDRYNANRHQHDGQIPPLDRDRFGLDERGFHSNSDNSSRFMPHGTDNDHRFPPNQQFMGNDRMISPNDRPFSREDNRFAPGDDRLLSNDRPGMWPDNRRRFPNEGMGQRPTDNPFHPEDPRYMEREEEIRRIRLSSRNEQLPNEQMHGGHMDNHGYPSERHAMSRFKEDEKFTGPQRFDGGRDDRSSRWNQEDTDFMRERADIRHDSEGPSSNNQDGSQEMDTRMTEDRQFRRGPDDPMRRGPDDPLRRGPDDPMRRGPDDFIRRGPDDPMRRGPDDFIRRGPDDPMRRGPDDPMRRGPDDPMGIGPDDFMRRGPDDRMRRGPDDPMRRGHDDFMRRGPDDPMRRGHDDFMKRGPDDFMRRGPDDSMRRGPDDFMRRGPDEPMRGPDDFMRRGPDEPMRGPDDFMRRGPDDPMRNGPDDPMRRGPDDFMRRGPDDLMRRGPNNPMRRGLDDPMMRGPDDFMRRGPDDPMRRGRDDFMRRGPDDPMRRGPDDPMRGPDDPMRRGPDDPMRRGPHDPMRKGPDDPMRRGPEDFSRGPDDPRRKGPDDPMRRGPEFQDSTRKGPHVPFKGPIGLMNKEQGPDSLIGGDSKSPATSAPGGPIKGRDSLPRGTDGRVKGPDGSIKGPDSVNSKDETGPAGRSQGGLQKGPDGPRGPDTQMGRGPESLPGRPTNTDDPSGTGPMRRGPNAPYEQGPMNQSPDNFMGRTRDNREPLPMDIDGPSDMDQRFDSDLYVDRRPGMPPGRGRGEHPGGRGFGPHDFDNRVMGHRGGRGGAMMMGERPPRGRGDFFSRGRPGFRPMPMGRGRGVDFDRRFDDGDGQDLDNRPPRHDMPPREDRSSQASSGKGILGDNPIPGSVKESETERRSRSNDRVDDNSRRDLSSRYSRRDSRDRERRYDDRRGRDRDDRDRYRWRNDRDRDRNSRRDRDRRRSRSRSPNRSRDRDRDRDRERSSRDKNSRTESDSSKSTSVAKTDQKPSRYVFVKNMPLTVSYRDMRRFFSPLEIPFDGLKLINNDQGDRIGEAYVFFHRIDDAIIGQKRNGMRHEGREVSVTFTSEAEFVKAVDSYVPPYNDKKDQYTKSQPLKPEVPKPSENTDFIAQLNNLPKSITRQDVRQFFKALKICKDGEAIYIEFDAKGVATGNGFVEFDSSLDLKKALTQNGLLLGTSKVQIIPGKVDDANKLKAAQGEMFQRAALNNLKNISLPPVTSTNQNQSPAPNPNKSISSGNQQDPKKPAPPTQSSQNNKNDPAAAANSKDDGSCSDTVCVHIQGLPLLATPRDIKEFFSDSQIALRGINIAHDNQGKPLGEGFVEFKLPIDFEKALKKDKTAMGRHIVAVKPISKKDMIDRLNNVKHNKTTEPPNKPQTSQLAQSSPGKQTTPSAQAPVPTNQQQGSPKVQPNTSTQKGAQPMQGQRGPAPPNSQPEPLPSRQTQPNGSNSNIPLPPNSNVGGPGMPPIPPGGPAMPLLRTPGPMQQVMMPGGGKSFPPGVLNSKWYYVRCQNFPADISIGEIMHFFIDYRPMGESIRLHYASDGRPTGNAVVGFMTADEANRALQDLNHRMCRHNTVSLHPA